MIDKCFVEKLRTIVVGELEVKKVSCPGRLAAIIRAIADDAVSQGLEPDKRPYRKNAASLVRRNFYQGGEKR